MVVNTKIELPKKPDAKINVADVFNIDSKITVKGFKEKSDWVPEIDTSYPSSEKTSIGKN